MNGTLKCWGAGGDGQLGQSDYSNRNVPTTVMLASPALLVACGGSHTCAYLSSASVVCFGDGGQGQVCVCLPFFASQVRFGTHSSFFVQLGYGSLDSYASPPSTSVPVPMPSPSPSSSPSMSPSLSLSPSPSRSPSATRTPAVCDVGWDHYEDDGSEGRGSCLKESDAAWTDWPAAMMSSCPLNSHVLTVSQVACCLLRVCFI